MLRIRDNAACALGMLFLVGMMGCGSGIPASPTAAASSGLNGNWLITGTLPFIDPLNFGNQGFGISMTFALTGSNITAGGTQNVPCGNFTVGGSSVLSGTLAADGTVTVQSITPGTPGPSLTITGKGPATGASSWTGTYTYMSGSTSCPQPLAGAFTATRIADVTGTYSPVAPVQLTPAAFGAKPQAVTMAFSFVQGAMLPGTTQFDPDLLSGTVQIQGSTCFNSGATTSLLGSGLLGTTFVTSLTLNDGSTMHFLGDIEDAGSDRLVVQALVVTGPTCGTLSSQPFEVVKQ